MRIRKAAKIGAIAGAAIIAALSFVIALSWKDLIIKVVDNILKTHLTLENYPYFSQLISAV